MTDDGLQQAAYTESHEEPSTETIPAPAETQSMTLRGVRKELGRTQVEVARQAGMSQGDLSRLERRNDHLLSTLERYAEALGGRLDIALIREGQRFPLEFGRNSG